MEIGYRRLVVREELFILLGDVISAHVLGQFIYWTKRTRDFHEWLEEEKIRASGIPSEKISGWIWKSARELLSELFIFKSEKALYRRLSQLVNMGVLDRRRNPHHKWDRTYQYRLNLLNLVDLLWPQKLPDKEFEEFYEDYEESKENFLREQTQIKPQDEIQPTGQSYPNSQEQNYQANLPPSEDSEENNAEGQDEKKTAKKQKQEADPETILRLYEETYRRVVGKKWPWKNDEKKWQRMRAVLKEILEQKWGNLNEEKRKIDWWIDFFEIAAGMAQK